MDCQRHVGSADMVEVSGQADTRSNAMLELSPQYFEYMQSTFNKATSLIKIVGFYSGESRAAALLQEC